MSLILFKNKIISIENSEKIRLLEPTFESTSEPTPDQTVFDTTKPTKAQTKKSKHKISLLKLCENLVSKSVNYEENINNEICKWASNQPDHWMNWLI